MRKLLLLLFIAFTAINIAAQGLVLKNYTTNDGLPSSETYSIKQDNRGFIWIATDRGLVKYDGYDFRVFNTSNGLNDNTLFELFLDDKGVLWYKTISSGLGYTYNDSFFAYKYNDRLSGLLSGQILSYLMFTDNGELIFTWGLSRGLRSAVIRANGFLDSSGNAKQAQGMPQIGWKKIFLNHKNEKFVLGMLDGAHTEVYDYETNTLLGAFKTRTVITEVLVAHSKKGNGVFVYASGGVYHLVNGHAKLLYDIGDGEALSLIADNDDNLWLGKRYRGAIKLDAKEGYKKTHEVLLKNSVSSIFKDREGGLWFSTLEAGVFYAAPLQFVALTEGNGLPLAKTNKLLTIDSNVFVVLDNNNIVIKNTKKQTIETIQGFWPSYFDIVYSPPGIIYTMNYQGGSLIDIKIDDKKIVFLQPSKQISLGKKYVWGHNYFTIFKYTQSGELIEETDIGKEVARAICLYELENGDLLLGTIHGLYLYKNGVFEHLKKRNPLLGERVSSIKSINNKLLITTIGNGFFIVDENDFAHPIQYTTANGLPSMVCNASYIDNDSTAWIATNRGLCRVRWANQWKKADWFTVDAGDGIISNEIISICKAANELWLATPQGISIVPVDNIDYTPPTIPMYITAVQVNGSTIKNYTPTTFAYNQNNISISYTAINFSHTAKLQYRYRISGDTNWYTTNNRTVVFNGLQPGNYVFEVSAVLPNENLSPVVIKYYFAIATPFWLTWWFITLVVLGVVSGLVYITYRIIIAKQVVQYKRAQQERKLAQLELEAIKAQINPHFIYNCLNSIQYFNYKSDFASVKKYFGLLAKLIRQTMQFSHETFVTLNAEVNYLSNYLELEKIRYKDNLTYTVNVSPRLSQTVLIPSMLIQPYVENALKHGISNLEGGGLVRIDFSLKDEKQILVVIEDNGPGLKETDTQDGVHFGNRLTTGRIASYNQLFYLNIDVNVIQRTDPHGLRVEITLPLFTQTDTAFWVQNRPMLPKV